jgi:hypothetical protein
MDGEYRSDYLFTLGCFSQSLIANEFPEYLNFTFHVDPYCERIAIIAATNAFVKGKI